MANKIKSLKEKKPNGQPGSDENKNFYETFYGQVQFLCELKLNTEFGLPKAVFTSPKDKVEIEFKGVTLIINIDKNKNEYEDQKL